MLSKLCKVSVERRGRCLRNRASQSKEGEQMRSVILHPSHPLSPTLSPHSQSAWTVALSPTAKSLLQSEWRLNIPWNQSSLAFWMHSQSLRTFHMQMWVLFISFVALVGQRCHAEGRWIKLVNLRLIFGPRSLSLFIIISRSRASALSSPAGV